MEASILKDIEQAIMLLKQGKVCALPTETVYGLAADATNTQAVAQIYALKNRPHFNPLIVHIASFQQAHDIAEISDKNAQCCTFFWDLKAPLTVVLPLKNNHKISPLVTASLDTIALRMPHHPIIAEIIHAVGPLAAPSANRSMHISPTTADHIRSSFGALTPHIVDAGPCRVGVESTILDLSTETPTLLRAGGVPLEALEAYFQQPLTHFNTDHDKGNTPSSLRAPGMMKKHYAPKCAVVLERTTKQPGDVLLGFATDINDSSDFNLSPTGDLTEAAANLFSALYYLEHLNPKRIIVAPIPKHGLGLAINDRLKRAAAQ